MFTAKSASLRAFVRGERTFRLFGITLTIQHAHDDEYQVLLPDMSEIFRIVDCGNGSAKLYVV
jgi:hypothetical protein